MLVESHHSISVQRCLSCWPSCVWMRIPCPLILTSRPQPPLQLSEALWAGAKRSSLSQTLCWDLTNACKKKTPPLPKVRGEGVQRRRGGRKKKPPPHHCPPLGEGLPTMLGGGMVDREGGGCPKAG